MPRMMLLALIAAFLPAELIADEPTYSDELIFPLHPKHNHAPAIVECPDGTLFVSWYRGSGERTADDLAVYGAHLRKGATHWTDAFSIIDNPGFPDGNTAMFVDSKQRLWLFWPVIIANTWESCLTNYRVSSNYSRPGVVEWEWQGAIYLKPKDFQKTMHRALDLRLQGNDVPRNKERIELWKKLIDDKLSQRLGWQPRCKPTVLPSGRILLPLYSDTYSVSLMAISDDSGKTWYASGPLAGFGSIQPTVLRRRNGRLIAYMRENGPLERIRISESRDDGLTWGPVGTSELPNPGSGLDGMTLKDGHWLLVYNDTTEERHSLAVSLSSDEGRTWKWTRHLEHHDSGRYHYPAVTQGSDETIHAVYSYHVKGGETMKHAAFNVAWIKEKE